jgi:hypothetical protein
MATDELLVQHNRDSVEINLGDGEILTLSLPIITINNINNQELKTIPFPPEILIPMEGELIGRSFSDLSLGRVAVVDWTVYSDNWDNEQWTVLSWVIVQKGGLDETKYIQENIDLIENIQRMIEKSNFNVDSI